MLEGIVRDSMTKQATKTLRRDGFIIANIYGKGLENISAAFKKNEFIKYLRNKETIAFDVKVGENVCKVVVQEYQKEPITSDLVHVDLMVAQPGVKTTYKVPVIAEGSPIGVKNKGLFVYHKKRIPVQCTIENLPESFIIPVDKIDVGHSVLVRNLTLPEGVSCHLDPRVPILGVIKAK